MTSPRKGEDATEATPPSQPLDGTLTTPDDNQEPTLFHDDGEPILGDIEPEQPPELSPVFVALLDELGQGIHSGPAKRAIVLGTTLEVAEALFAGESVPVDRLDPTWVARYGRRDR